MDVCCYQAELVRRDSQVHAVQMALLDLPDLQDNLVIQDSKDRRVGLGGLAEQAWLEALALLAGPELQARKVRKDRRATLDSRDQREILDRLVRVEHRDSPEMPVHREIPEVLDSRAAPVGLEVQASAQVYIHCYVIEDLVHNALHFILCGIIAFQSNFADYEVFIVCRILPVVVMVNRM